MKLKFKYMFDYDQRTKVKYIYIYIYNNNMILNKFVSIGFNWGIYNNIYLYVYMY